MAHTLMTDTHTTYDVELSNVDARDLMNACNFTFNGKPVFVIDSIEDVLDEANENDIDVKYSESTEIAFSAACCKLHSELNRHSDIDLMLADGTSLGRKISSLVRDLINEQWHKLDTDVAAYLASSDGAIDAEFKDCYTADDINRVAHELMEL